MPDKRLLRILPLSFICSVAIGNVALGMLFLIKDSYGAGPATVGWFTALLAGAYFAGCIVFRPLSSRIDASTSAILMCALSALLLGFQLALPSLATAFIANTLFGLATALLWPRLMGWLASGLEGEVLSRANGAFSLSWSSGLTLAPFIAGLLTERSHALGLGGALPIYVGVAIFAAAAIFMLATRRTAPAPRPAAPERGSSGRSSTPDHSTTLRYPAWMGLFAVYILQSILGNIFPLYAKDELAMGESAIGLFLLFRAAALAAGFMIFGRLGFWRFKPLYLPLSLGAVLALDLSLVFAHGRPAFAVLLILLGLVQSFVYSLSLFYGSSGAPDRDRRMSVHEGVLTIGQILGSVGGGGVYQGISWSMVFILSAALVLLLSPLQILLSRKR
jgi:MFS family permease